MSRLLGGCASAAPAFAGGIRARRAYVVPACLFSPTGKIGAKADVAWLRVGGVGRKLYDVAFIEKTRERGQRHDAFDLPGCFLVSHGVGICYCIERNGTPAAMNT